MNGAQFHLAVIHFPVAGAFFALGGLALAFLKRERLLSRWVLGFVLLVGLSGGAAFLSGEGAEETVETLVEVQGGWVHTHEEAAEVAAVALGLTSLAALIGLFLLRSPNRPDRPVIGTVFLFMILSAAFLARAAHFGGLVRHTELRSTAVGGSPLPYEDAQDH